MELRKRLEALMGADAPFVQPVLAVPFAFVAYPEKKHRVWVLHQDNLTNSLQAEGFAKRLDDKQISRIVETVTMLAGKSKDVWQRSSEEA